MKILSYTLLNLLGLTFGSSLVSLVQSEIYPELLQKEITGPLMSTFGIWALFFPLIFFFGHIFIVRALLKGSIVALTFILVEIAVVIAKSLYDLPVDINYLSGIPSIFLAIGCFIILSKMANKTFPVRQKAMVRYTTLAATALLAGHALVTGFSAFNKDNINRARKASGEWHAQFQPQDMEETEAEAEKACLILEGPLKKQQDMAFKETVQHAVDILEEANILFSEAYDISESHVFYHFKPIDGSYARAADVARIEGAVIQHVMKGDGIDDYAAWKAKYGLFLESSYDIFYKPAEEIKLSGPYLTNGSDSSLVFSIPLKDPYYIQNFWETKELQIAPNYLNEIMQGYGYEFDHVELWDVEKFNYVYDLNGFISHLLFSDVDFLNVTLEYLAKRERDQSISKMTLNNVLCSYPFRGELYERPAGISHFSPKYPEYKKCHPWSARMHCPGLEKPVRHKTNICRKLGEPFPECPTAEE